MNRQELYGTNFGWYMRDSVGAIALFLSGYGPVPRFVLSNADEHQQLELAMKNLPRVASSYFDADGSEVLITGKNYIFPEANAAAKGLYVYDNEEYTDQYNLIATPKVGINSAEISSEIQSLLQDLVFADLSFHDNQSIRLPKYFDCE